MAQPGSSTEGIDRGAPSSDDDDLHSCASEPSAAGEPTASNPADPVFFVTHAGVASGNGQPAARALPQHSAPV